MNLTRLRQVFTHKHFFIWLPPLLCYSLITYLSSLSHPPQVFPDFFLKDKVIHFSIYFLFGFLVARSAIWEYVWHPVWRWRLKLLIAILILLAGAVDEWHQSFVPNRMVEFWDWVADTLGAGTGAILTRLFYYWKHRDLKELATHDT